MFEITLRTKVALEAINVMSKNKNFIVGVGTLMTDHNIQNAINVGAKFGISPGISEELFEGCEKSNFPLIPGVSTPTEIMASYSRGYQVLKFFPATVLGGMSEIEMIRPLAAADTAITITLAAPITDVSQFDLSDDSSARLTLSSTYTGDVEVCAKNCSLYPLYTCGFNSATLIPVT